MGTQVHSRTEGQIPALCVFEERSRQ